MIINGMFWVLCPGAPWRDLPERYGPWKTVYNRFNRWSKSGVINIIFNRLLTLLDANSLIDWSATALDGSNIRALRCAAGAQKTSQYRRSWKEHFAKRPAAHRPGLIYPLAGKPDFPQPGVVYAIDGFHPLLATGARRLFIEEVDLTIESLNRVIRHAVKKHKVFPRDDTVKKVVWLAIQSASQKWTMPLRDWRMAVSRFIIEFGDRLDAHF